MSTGQRKRLKWTTLRPLLSGCGRSFSGWGETTARAFHAPRVGNGHRANFSHISAINGNYITFAEPFSHAFETRGDLRLARQANGGGYPENISFDGVKFSLSPGGTSAYVLFSRAYKGNFGAVRFGKGVGFSWGMSEGFTARSIETEHHGSIESVSNWHIGRYIGEGHAGAGPSGALLLNATILTAGCGQFSGLMAASVP